MCLICFFASALCGQVEVKKAEPRYATASGQQYQQRGAMGGFNQTGSYGGGGGGESVMCDGLSKRWCTKLLVSHRAFCHLAYIHVLLLLASHHWQCHRRPTVRHLETCLH